MKRRKLPFWILGYVAVILVIAVVINVAMGLSIPTSASLNGPSWLGFWGSYLGGAIGCIPALAALLHSKAQAEEQKQNVEKDRHLANLPVLEDQILHIKKLSDLSQIGLSSISAILESSQDPKGYAMYDSTVGILREILEADSTDVMLLQVKNVGHGPALSVNLHFETTFEFPLGTLAEGETVNLILSLNRSPERTYPLKFSFGDMLNWKYSQSHEAYVGVARMFISPITPPTLEE